MVDEIVDIFDEGYRKRGTANRELAYVYGMWLNSFHCWLYRRSDGGKVLFQKRSSSKKLFPDCLDISAAGHLQTGESALDGVREIKEELGIQVDSAKLIRLGIKHDIARMGDVVNRQFCHVFLYEIDCAIPEMGIDPQEVTGLVEISVSDGLALFSGAKSSVAAKGIEYESESQQWLPIEKSVSVADFVPRIDPYYYKIFILVDRVLKGEQHLAI
jgi:isopentenyldiphosphate isomerase